MLGCGRRARARRRRKGGPEGELSVVLRATDEYRAERYVDVVEARLVEEGGTLELRAQLGDVVVNTLAGTLADERALNVVPDE